MAWPAWIAAPIARTASRLAAPFIIGGAVILALLGLRRTARKRDQKTQQLKHRAETAEAAAKRGKENAERLQDMSDARADGPHSHDDIIDRLRNGDT